MDAAHRSSGARRLAAAYRALVGVDARAAAVGCSLRDVRRRASPRVPRSGGSRSIPAGPHGRSVTRCPRRAPARGSTTMRHACVAETRSSRRVSAPMPALLKFVAADEKDRAPRAPTGRSRSRILGSRSGKDAEARISVVVAGDEVVGASRLRARARVMAARGARERDGRTRDRAHCRSRSCSRWRRIARARRRRQERGCKASAIGSALIATFAITFERGRRVGRRHVADARDASPDDGADRLAGDAWRSPACCAAPRSGSIRRRARQAASAPGRRGAIRAPLAGIVCRRMGRRRAAAALFVAGRWALAAKGPGAA